MEKLVVKFGAVFIEDEHGNQRPWANLYAPTMQGLQESDLSRQIADMGVSVVNTITKHNQQA